MAQGHNERSVMFQMTRTNFSTYPIAVYKVICTFNNDV